jgi:16S rRNA (guanine527-N7)-methyltransferase
VSEFILRYFPHLSDIQKDRFSKLKGIYDRWNNMINLISRKDMDNFYIHHVLHSLSIAKVIGFLPGTSIIDIGTGGGFPGIPLAILFPDSEFTMLDSTGKKIKVVSAVSEELGLKNVTTLHKRIEDETGRYQFAISRAVTGLQKFINLSSKNITPGGINSLRNGIFYLKGGDLTEELSSIKKKTTVWQIKDFFEEPYFETKVIVYLPV